MKHKSKEFIINTPFVLLGEWCLLDWLGVTWEPPTKIVELNQGVFKGKEIAYFMKIYR